MKMILLSICAVVPLLGCSPRPQDKAVTVRPLVAANVVKVHDNLNNVLPVGDITNTDRVEKFVSFVNSLPQDWSVPWYGPPVGRVYFDFYRGETNVGNLYVGPNFFGRDVYYREGSVKFYSQSASKTQIQDLGRIIGFDLWKYVQEP
jgi:hypothetical protein